MGQLNFAVEFFSPHPPGLRTAEVDILGWYRKSISWTQKNNQTWFYNRIRPGEQGRAASVRAKEPWMDPGTGPSTGSGQAQDKARMDADKSQDWPLMNPSTGSGHGTDKH
jgi:hypothetical protein